MRIDLPDDWRLALARVLDSDDFRALAAFVDAERDRGDVFPPEDKVFAAFARTPLSSVHVVVVGQDPYHDVGQAHGLCFSVEPPHRPPPSLKNIYKELAADVGVATPTHGDLSPWAARGVLLLNTVLTVRAHEPASHKGKGWEQLTDAAIAAVSARAAPAVFCLWGQQAHKKRALVDESRHAVVVGAHPSPLSARHFLGSRPFSAINTALQERGVPPIDWTLSADAKPAVAL